MMLDDMNVLKQRDPSGTLAQAAELHQTVTWTPEILEPEFEEREITAVIIAGMGGSALAADIFYVLAQNSLGVPVQVVKDYDLPSYAGPNTLVIAMSHSGNTEETLSCYATARDRGCQVAAIAVGGKLAEHAATDKVVHALVKGGGQPRMAMLMHLRALLKIVEHFGLIDSSLYDEMAEHQPWLKQKSQLWHRDVPVHENYAKQLALHAVGKTPVFYGGPLTAPLAYKLKISWNESGKNLAFWNQYPEFNHNEFVGWSSHPVEKPFVIYDLVTELERERIHERMQLTDRLLSGLRPAATEIHLQGETMLQQSLWTCILADFASCYLGIVNGVDPEPVVLVEKLKKQLS